MRHRRWLFVLILVASCATATKKTSEERTAGLHAREPVPVARTLAATDSTPRPLTIGAWNIKWFGKKKADQYDYVTMADFMEECDVIAVQEVAGSNFKACLESLKTELNADGRSYDFVFSASTGYRNNPDSALNGYEERHAFFWDTDRVRLKSGSARLLSSPAINHKTYRQVPFRADFEVTKGNGFDFRLASVHTVYNKKINFVRERELKAIRKWVKSASGKEKDKIAIGDFNANPPSQAHFFVNLMANPQGFRVLMNESRDAGEPTIRTSVPTLDKTDSKYLAKPVYDHVLVSAASSGALTANPTTRAGGHLGVNDFDNDPWWKANGWSRRELIAVVSDHRAIWFTMNYMAADNDPD